MALHKPKKVMLSSLAIHFKSSKVGRIYIPGFFLVVYCKYIKNKVCRNGRHLFRLVGHGCMPSCSVMGYATPSVFDKIALHCLLHRVMGLN